MNRSNLYPMTLFDYVPRERGDEPVEVVVGVSGYRCSPRARG